VLLATNTNKALKSQFQSGLFVSAYGFWLEAKSKSRNKRGLSIKVLFKSIFKLVSRIFLQSMTSRIDKKMSFFKKKREENIASNWDPQH